MTQPLPTEIVMLGLGAVLLLLQMFLQSVSSAVELGVGYKMGYRDDSRVVRSVIAGRADRAFRNLLETFPIFAALRWRWSSPGAMAASVRSARRSGSSCVFFTCRCI